MICSCDFGQCTTHFLSLFIPVLRISIFKILPEFLFFKFSSSTKNEKIIEQQLLLDQLSGEPTKLNLSMTSSAKEICGDGPDARIPEKRPYTVPFDARLGRYIYIPERSDARKVKSKH